MEANVVEKRLIEAAVLATVPRPSYAPGNFTITVQIQGVLIVYIFDAGPGHYQLDHFVTWHQMKMGVSNPLALAMTGLLIAARDYKP